MAQARNQSLDILRAAAILLVLAFHVPHYAALGRAGWIGVDLFFVLSGFLISGLLFAEINASGTLNFWRFIFRRGFKIWPSFYALLLATLLVSLALGRPTPAGGFLANSLFLQNYFFDHSPWHVGLLGHTWSLGVEEHFYLALPLLLLWLGRKRLPWIPAICAFLFVACLAMRWHFTAVGPVSRVIAPTHLRVDSLFAGVTVSYLKAFRPRIFEKLAAWYALPIAAVAVLPAFLADSESRWIQTFGLTGLAIGFSFLLAWSVTRDLGKVLGAGAARLLASIGVYSYSIYLWHWLVSVFANLMRPTALVFWAYMAFAIALGILASEMIEKPFLRLRERLSSRSTKEPAPAVPVTA